MMKLRQPDKLLDVALADFRIRKNVQHWTKF